MEYRPTLEEARRIAREGTYKVLPVSCEILADLGMGFLRWDRTAVFSDDPRLEGACQALMPEVYKMYQEMGWKFKYFTLENGCAELVKADNSKEKIL